MKELLGETIYSIYRSEDKTILAFFDCFDFSYIYISTADCCSESWFDDISDRDVLIGNEVIGIEINSKKEDSPEEYALDHNCHMTTYGYTLKTSEGYCDIIYRNLSNGYYGGDCHYLPECVAMTLQNKKAEAMDYLSKKDLKIVLKNGSEYILKAI